MEHQLPSVCPVCANSLYVSKLTCANCHSEISGKFTPCKYCALSDKMQLFLEAFLKSRGNIKEVERTLAISYPTVKGLLDQLLAELFDEQPQANQEGIAADEIFDLLEKKEISVDEAAALLAGKEISKEIKIKNNDLGSDENE